MKQKSNLKMDSDILRAVLLFAAVCEFPIFERMSSTMGTILSAIKLIALVYCLFRMGRRKRFKKSEVLNKMHFWFLLYCIVGAISTALSTPEQMLSYIKNYLYPYISTLIVFETIFVVDKYHFNEKISAIAKYLGIFIWINFATMIIWKNGIITSSASSARERANWIFGSKNNIVPFLPIILCVIGMDMVLNKEKKNSAFFDYATLGIAFLSFSSMGETGFEFLSGSTTALVEILAFFLISILFDRFKNTRIIRWFTMRNICIVSVAFMAIIVDVSQGSDGLISRVVSLLGKDIGFTGRYSVWAKAVETIKESPVFGIGLEERIFPTWNSRWSYNTSIYSYWLSIGVRFGLAGLIANFMMFSVSDKNGSWKDPVSFMCKLSFFIMMIGGLTSIINIRYWMMILMLVYLWNQYGYHQNQAAVDHFSGGFNVRSGVKKPFLNQEAEIYESSKTHGPG